MTDNEAEFLHLIDKYSEELLMLLATKLVDRLEVDVEIDSYENSLGGLNHEKYIAVWYYPKDGSTVKLFERRQ